MLKQLEYAMSLANDLENLEQLRNRGALSETEYSQAKARLLQQPETPRPNASSLNGLRRSNVDRWLGGVCGGLARRGARADRHRADLRRHAAGGCHRLTHSPAFKGP